MHHILVALFVAVSMTVAYSGIIGEENASTHTPQVIRITPRPRTYSMEIKEYHECVACHDDDQARNEYNNCLRKLSSSNQRIAKICCSDVFGNKFCDNAASGNTDFDTICQDPKKAIKAARCFWEAPPSRNTTDIAELRACKRDILLRFCTTRSGDWDD